MKKFGIIILAFIALFCFCNLSYAETDVTFAYNIVEDVPDLAGFKLFQRENINDYDYSNPVAIINDPNSETYTLNGVPDGKNLYWVVRAFDVDGLESPDSNEVNQLQTGPPPAPGFSIIKVTVDVEIKP